MAINSKNTKAEILSAYKELEKEKTELENKLKAGQNLNLPLEKTPPIPENKTNDQKKNTDKNEEKTMNISNANISQIIQNLETLQVSFGGAVSQLSEQLITEASTVEKLQTEIQGEIDKLRELHDLETIEENTLDELINNYQTSEENFILEYSQREESLRQELENLSKEWQKEQETKQREIKIRNDNYNTNKQREQDEYYYNLQLERQLNQESYEQEINNFYKELEETKQQQEKVWEEREKAIFEKEKEYEETKQKVKEFEEKLSLEIKKAKEEGKGIGTYQAKVKADLRQKEIEGETQNYLLRIQALESTINNNENRINNLSHQLESALKQVQDLAVKAIEGTSNRNSFEAMKEVALEQAKNQQKSK
ncbi:hypothetical protein VKI21_00700 [Cyanobacterium aponinum UTEX 3222]|uniref:hypothetical protein n=1 Tax=Cyanobacterium aponinum TaxID=379064 RepID=UPI00308B1EFC|nr:hypothetical protein VKI21_00700 [Cyanobacterium aponinum UTEX 3222]